MTVRVIGINQTISQVNGEFDKMQEQALRRNALNLVADLRRATPVDQGFARNSWNIGYTNTLVDTRRGGSARSTLSPVSTPRTIYVTNGVPYINRLNEGSSRQAPSNFIEEAIYANFDSFTGDIS